jgi:hypothetical protein
VANPTTIEVAVSDTEFSRYEEDRNTITATVVISGGAPYTTEKVVVDLIKARRSRDAVVATATLEFTNTADPQEQIVEFYLPDVVDQDLIHLIRHGKYFVKASSFDDEDVFGVTPDFDISIITVDRLKSNFLFGIDLSATEIREPKFQPQQITGITIIEVSRTHPFGMGTLNYITHVDNITNATASIGSGVDGTVTITADEDNAGDAGNAFTVQVFVPAGTSALSVALVGNQLKVNLDVTAGVPNAVANTATLVAAAINALTGFSAVASGAGTSSLSTVEGPTQFTGGTSNHVRQINWNGGPLVSITGPGTYILFGGLLGPANGVCQADSNSYIVIRVRSTLLLPSVNTTEVILIDKKKITDSTLRDYICQAISFVENDLLATPVEPTNVVTERDPTTLQFSAGVNAPAPLFTDTDFDKIVSPLTYFLPRTGSWITIQTPWMQLLRVDSLFGAIANTRVLDIDLEWIEHSEQGGLIQLVPFSSEIAFDFIGLIWVNAIRGSQEIPNFWHYNAIVGLRDAPCEIIELIAKKAAINALTVAGMALRPGVGSLSLSRDGVSESVSYTTGAQYGIYTGTIQAYKDWIEENSKLLRAKYRGCAMVIV